MSIDEFCLQVLRACCPLLQSVADPLLVLRALQDALSLLEVCYPRHQWWNNHKMVKMYILNGRVLMVTLVSAMYQLISIPSRVFDSSKASFPLIAKANSQARCENFHPITIFENTRCTYCTVFPPVAYENNASNLTPPNTVRSVGAICFLLYVYWTSRENSLRLIELFITSTN